MKKYTLYTILSLALLTGCTCGAGGLCSFQISDRTADQGQAYLDSQEAAILAHNYQNEYE